LTSAKNDEYEGEWKDDRREGKGIQKYADGSSYEGTWKDDKVHLNHCDLITHSLSISLFCYIELPYNNSSSFSYHRYALDCVCSLTEWEYSKQNKDFYGNMKVSGQQVANKEKELLSLITVINTKESSETTW
jgi:hypothetical protein